MREKNNLFIRCLVEHSCMQSKASQSSSCRFKSVVLVIIFHGAFNPGIPATSLNQDIELVTAWFGLVTKGTCRLPTESLFEEHWPFMQLRIDTVLHDH